jgi:Flp pilus assembly protein TadG
MLREILPNDRGVIAVKFAMVLPVLLAAFGFTIDRARFVLAQDAAQSLADTAALAAAKELSLADRKHEDLAAIVQSIAESYAKQDNAETPKTTTTVTSDPMEVEVTVSAKFRSMFKGVTLLTFPEVRSRAVARIVGKPNICVLGLNDSEVGTISLEQNARVTGQNCAVYSNSDHTRGLKAKNSASLTASIICTRGGKDGGPGNFSPSPLVDCPSFEDPLLARPEPAVGACDPAMPTVISTSMTLDPGTYCGLELTSGANVTLRDGVFVIKDNPLIVRDGAQLHGASAGFFFTGADATFTFETGSTISLSAQADGPMAGLLMFTSRSQDPSLKYKILSDDARVMVGTIYVPQGELIIDASNPIADQSAYTAIVADKMRLYGGPHLVLNTRYSETEVPVPDGIRGAGQPVVLAR